MVKFEHTKHISEVRVLVHQKNYLPFLHYGSHGGLLNRNTDPSGGSWEVGIVAVTHALSLSWTWPVGLWSLGQARPIWLKHCCLVRSRLVALRELSRVSTACVWIYPAGCTSILIATLLKYRYHLPIVHPRSKSTGTKKLLWLITTCLKVDQDVYVEWLGNKLNHVC
jgi:hypothetical protein